LLRLNFLCCSIRFSLPIVINEIFLCSILCIYIHMCVCIFSLNNLLRLNLRLNFVCCSIRFQSAAFILCELLAAGTLCNVLMQNGTYKHLDYLRYRHGTNKGKAKGLVPSAVDLVFKKLFPLSLLFRIVPVACNSCCHFFINNQLHIYYYTATKNLLHAQFIFTIISFIYTIIQLQKTFFMPNLYSQY
jgi:hypothetical protein